jgi:hypothetical protein
VDDGGADESAVTGPGFDRVKPGAGGKGFDRTPAGDAEGGTALDRTGCALGEGAGGMGLGAALGTGDIETGTERTGVRLSVSSSGGELSSTARSDGRAIVSSSSSTTSAREDRAIVSSSSSSMFSTSVSSSTSV